MVTAALTRDEIMEILTEVKDPELPFIDVVELGIVRDVIFDGAGIRVDVTPTYSGCPAIRVIESDIVAALNAHGLEDVRVNTVFSPAWTTDWLSEATKQKFRNYGIAPPHAVNDTAGIAELVSLRRASAAIECPFCTSSNTEQKSVFGSTACKSIHFCNSCHQPFDHFKAF